MNEPLTRMSDERFAELADDDSNWEDDTSLVYELYDALAAERAERDTLRRELTEEQDRGARLVEAANIADGSIQYALDEDGYHLGMASTTTLGAAQKALRAVIEKGAGE